MALLQKRLSALRVSPLPLTESEKYWPTRDRARELFERILGNVDGDDESFPRSPTEREAMVLAHLLTIDAPGIHALREQANGVAIVGRCPCPCATRYLSPDPCAPVSELEYAEIVAAHAAFPDEEPMDVMLFVTHGRLDSVEMMWLDEPLPVFPPPAALECPRMWGTP